MKFIFQILIFFLLVVSSQKTSYYNKDGKPSSWGISRYIEDNHINLIKEYEQKIDTLYDVFIFADNSLEENKLGEFYLPDYVIISTQEKYIEYEYKNLSKLKQRLTSYTDRTVKAVVFHELTHVYFNQTYIILKNSGKYVYPEYGSLMTLSNPIAKFGAQMIEEGICEYTVHYLQESSPLKNIYIPKTKDELLDKTYEVNNLYWFSVLFLKDFLDKHGIKKGIEILISNKPPSFDEILNSELFFNRLEYK